MQAVNYYEKPSHVLAKWTVPPVKETIAFDLLGKKPLINLWHAIIK
jgi:hypothetical protein